MKRDAKLVYDDETKTLEAQVFETNGVLIKKIPVAQNLPPAKKTTPINEKEAAASKVA